MMAEKYVTNAGRNIKMATKQSTIKRRYIEEKSFEIVGLDELDMNIIEVALTDMIMKLRSVKLNHNGKIRLKNVLRLIEELK